MNHAQFWGGGGAAPYEIEQSLRFNSGDSSYLSRTTSGFGITTTCTISWWHKRAAGSTSNTNWMCGSYPNMWSWELADGSSNGFRWTNKGGTVYGPSGSKYRDYSGWYHWIVTQSGTVSKVYLNGELLRQDNSNSGSDATNWYIGSEGGTDNFLNGYLAEFHFLDGTAVTDATSFGEFDDNGVWRPIEYTGGNYGTDGFYLKFDPSATNGIGHDHSGNGNHFSPTGFTTSGTGTDVMSDTPTNNFATLNPIYQPFDMSFSDGNLFFQPTTSNWRSAQSTIPVTGSGKYYCEMKLSSINQARMCLTSIQDPNLFNVGVPSYSSNNGLIVDDNLTAVTYGSSWTSGDVIAMAIDMDNGSVAFYKNGSLQGTVTGLDTSLLWRPGVIAYTASSNGYFNFGQRAFEQTPPTGFNPISTSNLPAPDIADGSDYFNTVLYTGTGTTNARTDVGFQPDLTWIKIRSTTSNHAWYDAIRGSTKVIGSSATDAESTDGSVTPTSTGFTLGSENTSFGSTNGNGYTYVAWNWLGANGTSTPSGGSIASTVSANPSAGFSIVSYVGTFAAETIAHGLNNAPSMIITKSRDTADRWQVYHSALGNGYTLRLEETTAAGADAGAWNSTSPTSTVFSVGTSVRTNRSGDDFIAYCFAEVEGYSKFGSYTGNGSGTDGPFVYCGFKPSWVMLKHYSGTITYQENATWNIYDATRDTYNVAGAKLMANASNGEAATTAIDILSNGFKLRGGGDDKNKNGGNYIFVAFASNPFGGSGVSPATAR